MSAKALSVAKPIASPNIAIIRRALNSGGCFQVSYNALVGMVFDPDTKTSVMVEGSCSERSANVSAVTVVGTGERIYLDQVLSRSACTRLNKRVFAYLIDEQDKLAAADAGDLCAC